MEDRKFKAILIILIPGIVEEIVTNDKLDEITATRNFYASKLYSLLEDEQTKLWHLSPKSFYLMYKEEQVTGKITFPEEV